MKIKIDTVEKIIQIEQECSLSELLTFVKKFFPDNEWKEYKIRSVEYVYGWWGNSPIYIPSVLGTQDFTITCTDGSETFCIDAN